MKILYICPRLPYPVDQGDKVIIYNHLKYLSVKHQITLLTFVQDKNRLDAIPHLSNYCFHIETFTRRPNLSFINILFALVKRDPFTVIRYYSPKMLKRSKALIESGEFDAVHTAFYYMGQYAVSGKISVPEKTVTILDTHNLEYLIYSRYARLAGNPFFKLFIRLESLRIKRYESGIYRKFDACIAFSELDRKNIVGLSGASNISVNPGSVELPAAGGEKTGKGREKNSILFFGLLNTLANDDAVRFFYEKIFPLIKRQVPDAKFIIAGRSAGRYIKGLSMDTHVEVAGLVPDIRGLIGKVSVIVAPLRLGGGIRVKILESWALGKAVVSTSTGAEGIEIKAGEDIVIADSAPDFAKEVVALLRDEDRRDAIGRAAAKKARELYDCDRIIRNLEEIYSNALMKKSRGADTENVVDVVILNFNQESDTEECVLSLKKMHNQNYRILLVDNGSTDDSGFKLKEKFRDIEFLRSDKNLGFAGGCNLGLKKSIEDGPAGHILLLNNDTIVSENLIDELLRALRVNNAAGIAGAVNFYYSKPDKVHMAGHRFLWWLGIQSIVTKMDSRFKELQSLSACCMLIKKEVVEKVGLFDERFFIYYEDSDLCLRARGAGFNVVAARDARVWHKISRVFGEKTAGEYYIYTRNQPLFMLKNCPRIFLLNYFIVYLLKVFTRILYFSITGRWALAEGVFKGFSDFLAGEFGEGKIFE